MRTRRGRAALVLGATLLLTGCTPHAEPKAVATSPPTRPTLGGASPDARPVPDGPMDRLERPVSRRLAAQVADQGLSLDYLECPAWDGTVPSRMTCRAYLDGLVARVRVHLEAAVEGKAVRFDAELADGVVATSNLEATLRHQGWAAADCGDVAAYPARTGSTIVCHVHRPGSDRYVVATVTDHSGAVTITAYRPPE